jgi:hypothetical protein
MTGLVPGTEQYKLVNRVGLIGTQAVPILFTEKGFPVKALHRFYHGHVKRK